jgi:hypothetical protein
MPVVDGTGEFLNFASRSTASGDSGVQPYPPPPICPVYFRGSLLAMEEKLRLFDYAVGWIDARIS